MKYTVGEYTFRTKREYRAALKDLQKIEKLEKTGRSTAEIARNYKKQIHDKRIVFRSRIGEDFVKEQDQKLFLRRVPSATLRYNREHPVSRHRVAFKWGTILALCMLISGLGYVFYANVLRDLTSIHNMREIQDTMARAAEREPEEAMTVAAADESVAAGLQEEALTIEEAPAEPVILPQYVELHEANPDLAGWLTIPDTVIDYPVMYREGDNDYYLEHNFEGKADKNGLLVLDKRCNADASGENILIHGHNMKSGFMFGSLDEYKRESYYENHRIMQFNTLYEEKTYEVMAVFLSSVYNSATTDFEYYDYIQILNPEDFETYVASVKEQSLYETGVDASYGDELITLSTCEYSKANGRLVVVGRRKK